MRNRSLALALVGIAVLFAASMFVVTLATRGRDDSNRMVEPVDVASATMGVLPSQLSSVTQPLPEVPGIAPRMNELSVGAVAPGKAPPELPTPRTSAERVERSEAMAAARDQRNAKMIAWLNDRANRAAAVRKR